MNLIVQPDDGVSPVVRAIHHARRVLDVMVFRTNLPEIEKAVGAAVQRGVKVRVLVAHTNRGGEGELRKLEIRMLELGATVSRTGEDFPRYHGKFLIADDTLHVFGFNFTKVDIAKSRSFGVSTKDASAVREARALFEADSNRQPFVPKRTHLVISPENAREELTAFVKGARRQLFVYDVNLEDPAFIKMLEQRAAAGVDVRVLGRMKGSSGVDARPLKPFRLHVRAMVRDGSQAFVGSQSLRRLELDRRREVGVIVRNGPVARRIREVFEADWLESDSGKGKKDKDKEKEAELAAAV